jgi:hypothetical protein
MEGHQLLFYKEKLVSALWPYDRRVDSSPLSADIPSKAWHKVPIILLLLHVE